MHIESNGSKWAGEAPDTLEQLLDVLKRETLDPSFEECGRFFYESSPNWHAFGNFLTLSHVFNISGTAAEMEPLRLALIAARKRPEYVRAYLDRYGKDPLCECEDRKSAHGSKACLECVHRSERWPGEYPKPCQKFKAAPIPGAQEAAK